VTHSLYETLRHLADSWGLVFMIASFLSFIGWALRPGARDHHREAATMIFDEDNGHG